MRVLAANPHDRHNLSGGNSIVTIERITTANSPTLSRLDQYARHQFAEKPCPRRTCIAADDIADSVSRLEMLLDIVRPRTVQPIEQGSTSLAVIQTMQRQHARARKRLTTDPRPSEPQTLFRYNQAFAVLRGARTIQSLCFD